MHADRAAITMALAAALPPTRFAQLQHAAHAAFLLHPGQHSTVLRDNLPGVRTP